MPLAPSQAVLEANAAALKRFKTEVVAAVICAEAQSEFWSGMCAVAQVIANRVKDGRWGPTAFEVVTSPGQFAVLNGTTPSKLVSRMRTEIGWGDALMLAGWLTDGKRPFQMINQIGASTHFHDTSVPAPKGWGPCLARVGKLRFYKPTS